MNNLTTKFKTLGIPVVILLIILLGVIYLLTQNNQVTDTTTNQDSTSTVEESNVNLIPVENLTQVKFSDTVVTFAEGYNVNTTVEASTVNGVNCSSENTTCIINFITDVANTYYISTPAAPIANDGLDRSNDQAKQFDTNSTSVLLNYSILSVTNDAGDVLPDQSLTSQIYGCITERVCVGSGMLDTTTLEANRESIAKFENFVRSINIQ